jgi:hypothetical protein
MQCNAMHPIQDLFLESFSYVLQIDMHFICTPMWTKKFILVKSGCYTVLARLGAVAFRFELPPSLAGVHNVFHASQLKKCLKVPINVAIK